MVVWPLVVHLLYVRLQEVIRLLNCDRATMWLPEKDGVRLYSLVQAYPPKINAKPMHIGVPLNDKSIVGSCMVNNQMINIQDAYEDDRFNSASDKVTGYHTRSILSFPIFEVPRDPCVPRDRMRMSQYSTLHTVPQY